MKKILSIDGGGYKGVFVASFLAEIEKKLGKSICEYFDIIAGTSTGGIIAAALSMGIPAEKILHLYLDKGKEIFPANRRFHILKGKYDTKPLEIALKKVFSDAKIKDCKTRLLIPAFDLQSRKVRVFKTTHSPDLYFDSDKYIVDCLLATTAAPLYFMPHKMESGVFIDGGVGANNPSLIALVEGMTRCGWTMNEICILNMGCTKEELKITGKEKMGLSDALTIQKCFMSAESQYVENICSLMLKERYIKINQEVLNGQVSLDKVSEQTMKQLKDWGINKAQEHIQRLNELYFQTIIDKPTFYNI